MKIYQKIRKKAAFSLIELSIVVTVIGVTIGAVLGGSSLIASAKLIAARTTTPTAPMLAMSNLSLWLETTTSASFSNGEDSNGTTLTVWNSINEQVPGVVATAGNNPIYTTNAINGLPGIAFTGDWFSIPDSDALSPTGDMTLFAVILKTTSNINGNILSKDTNSAYRWRIEYSINANWFLISDGSFQVHPGNVVEINTPVIVSAAIDIGSTVTLSENKVRSDVNATSKTSINDTSGPLIIGSGDAVGSEGFEGYIGEIIMFDRLLSQSEQDDIFDYLSNKWSIPLI